MAPTTLPPREDPSSEVPSIRLRQVVSGHLPCQGRRGAEVFRKWIRDDGRAQDGGGVSHLGGVDGGSDMVNALITLGDGFEEVGRRGFILVYVVQLRG
jgi:hypothetical protein